MKTPPKKSHAASQASIADAVCDELLSDHSGDGSFSKYVTNLYALASTDGVKVAAADIATIRADLALSANLSTVGTVVETILVDTSTDGVKVLAAEVFGAVIAASEAVDLHVEEPGREVRKVAAACGLLHPCHDPLRRFDPKGTAGKDVDPDVCHSAFLPCVMPAARGFGYAGALDGGGVPIT